MHSQNGYHVWKAATGFPFSNRNKMRNKNVNLIPVKKKISDEKQITQILTQNGIANAIHLDLFRVC